MPWTLFQGPLANFIVLLHAAAAIVLIGSTTHHAIITWGYTQGRVKLRLGRIYAAVMPVAYAATFAFGLLAYPTYRYWVRGLYLDRYAIWASNLFDIKENFAAIGAPLVLALFLLSRRFDPREERRFLAGYATLAFLVLFVVWFNVISGLLITQAKGV